MRVKLGETNRGSKFKRNQTQRELVLMSDTRERDRVGMGHTHNRLVLYWVKRKYIEVHPAELVM